MQLEFNYIQHELSHILWLCMSEYLQNNVVRKPAPSPPGKPAPRVQVSHSTCIVEIRDCLCTHTIMFSLTWKYKILLPHKIL